MPEPRSRRELRRFILARAQGCCEYCLSQAHYSTNPFVIEHIIPKSRGGRTHASNLALSCQGCNNHKYTKTRARDPLTKKFARLFHPRKQRWTDHLAWSADYTVIIGLTATGRATVDALRLNRAEIVNLRRVLLAVGEHPPVRRFT